MAIQDYAYVFDDVDKDKNPFFVSTDFEFYVNTDSQVDVGSLGANQAVCNQLNVFNDEEGRLYLGKSEKENYGALDILFTDPRGQEQKVSNIASLRDLFAGDDESNQSGTGLEDSEAVEEIEYTYFLKLDDFEQLDTLAKYKERQEQWSFTHIKNNIAIEARCRRISQDGHDQYIVGSKINFPNLDGKWEFEKEGNLSHFQTVKDNARSGMTKDRYFFPVDGTELVYEIDVFYDDNGNPVPWVKVDLEVPRRMAVLPPFPVEYVEAIINQGEAKTDQETRIVRGLFKNHYLKNKLPTT